jgi:alpha-1,3-mannosyltransferase
MGEPTHFCKDLWHLGYGKIAVVPSVNVEYDDDQSRQVKSRRGYVSDSVQQETTPFGSTLIDWKSKPPELIKCTPSYERPSWVRSDEALD